MTDVTEVITRQQVTQAIRRLGAEKPDETNPLRVHGAEAEGTQCVYFDPATERRCFASQLVFELTGGFTVPAQYEGAGIQRLWRSAMGLWGLNRDTDVPSGPPDAKLAPLRVFTPEAAALLGLAQGAADMLQVLVEPASPRTPWAQVVERLDEQGFLDG